MMMHKAMVIRITDKITRAIVARTFSTPWVRVETVP
jgi:hypothetical protein